jgi:hypothetical protein
LVAQRHEFRLARSARPEEPDESAPNQFEQIPHEAEHRPIRDLR